MQLPVLALVIALLSFGPAFAADGTVDETVDEAVDEAVDDAVEKKENLAHGFWMTDKGRSKVKVAPCVEAQGLCSEIIWLREPNNSRGVPLTDGRNQNPRLRKRPIMGLKILEGLKQIGRYEWEGEVYNPEDGKTYKANLALVKPDMLRLKGCMPMGWPCRSKFWTRTEFEPPAPVEVAEESVDVMVETSNPAAGGAAVQPQAQPPAAAPAPAEAQAASREAPVALTPSARNAPAPADPKPTPSPQQQAAVEPSQPAPSAAPPPVPAAPSNPTVSPPSPRATQPPSRTVAAPPPPPPPPVAPVQPQRQAAAAEPPAAPPARNVTPPTPPPAAARPPARQNVYPVAPVQPPAAATRQPPAATQQPAPPKAYPEVAALPAEPTARRGGGGSSYLVQVAARQDRNEAVAVFNDLRRRYPRLLGNAQPIIKRVNLGELGVWYRVRVGPIEGKAAALSLCNRLKFAGSDCFIRRQ